MIHWWFITKKFRWDVIYILFSAENIKEGVILDSWEQQGLGRLIICLCEHWQECLILQNWLSLCVFGGCVWTIFHLVSQLMTFSHLIRYLLVVHWVILLFNHMIHWVSEELTLICKSANCDPLCENPAKVIFLWFAVFQKKIILHIEKNILWKCNRYIFNIVWVKSCQRFQL